MDYSKKQQSHGVLIKKTSCIKCTSSDAMGVYTDHCYCFSCGKYSTLKEYEEMTGTAVDHYPRTKQEEPTQQPTKGSAPVLDRAISKATFEKYGVTFSYDQQGGVAKHHYPYLTQGLHAATKTRTVADKGFSWTGTSGGTQLFGQHLVPEGGKYITITEGELDAMSICEGLTWPAVSVKSASTALKDVQQAFKYLQTFGKIVLAFDKDDAGREASEKIAQRFPPGKVVIMDMGKYKDANDFLRAGDITGMTKAWWGAKPYTPDTVVNSSLLWDLLSSTAIQTSIPYPFEGLNKKTYGLRKSELVTITAGTGVGKSTFCKALAVYLKDIIPADENLGMLMIEESTKETGLSMMGLKAGVPFHLPDSKFTPEQYKKAFDDVFESGRFYLQADKMFAYSDIDGIMSTITFLANGCNCKYIVLDHISIITSGQANGDERRALDEISTKLKALTMQLDICLIIVCHLKRLSGTPAEEGAQITLSDLRGTAGIGHVSNIILALERNGQDPDKEKSNTINIRVLKNRFCGRLGVACRLVFDDATMQFIEQDDGIDEGSEGFEKVGE